jgi:triacylglycerol lipase
MLSAMLLWGMMVEVLALGALGRGVLGWSWGATVALVLGAMLLGRALTMAVTWLMAWRHPSVAPPLRAGQWLAMVLREYGAFVRGFVLVQPWVWLGMPADRLRASAQPMLLVHGYGCNRGIWWWLRPRLEAAGHVVARCQARGDAHRLVHDGLDHQVGGLFRAERRHVRRSWSARSSAFSPAAC